MNSHDSNHEWAQAKISDLVDNCLDDESELLEFAKHLVTCKECRTAAIKAQGGWRLVHDLPAPEISDAKAREILDTVKHRLEAERATEPEAAQAQPSGTASDAESPRDVDVSTFGFRATLRDLISRILTSTAEVSKTIEPPRGKLLDIRYLHSTGDRPPTRLALAEELCSLLLLFADTSSPVDQRNRVALELTSIARERLPTKSP